MTTVINGKDDLKAKVGEHLGYSEWFEVTQQRINDFADATGDHQWIHINEEMAKAGPFGTTIAHGYLTLSLVPMLLSKVMIVDGVKMGVNYGTNKVRLPAPVPSGSKIRLGATIVGVEDLPNGATQNLVDVTIETEGATKPSLVAQLVFLYYF
ncbi:MAG: MaoC family dehydratase [Actinomycetota bacterium]|jgi:acyl dehydratase|nr:MaoC family dehydratase [Actinomycetota bacterium]